MGTKMKRLTLSFLKNMAAERPIKQNSFLMRKDPIKIDGGWYIRNLSALIIIFMKQEIGAILNFILRLQFSAF